jgi:uncharacterized protein (DUF1501 family)
MTKHTHMYMQRASRRLFLQQVGALSTLGIASPMALNLAGIGSAAAQSASDYKALVCLFMFGGNDAINMVLPTDSTSWTNYSTLRTQEGTSPLALPPLGAAGGVLPINPTNAQGRTFALNPKLAPLADMFNIDKRLAVVPNVGPLVMPTTKAQFADNNHPKPSHLLSHNDQQSTWMSGNPEGARVGWGGRMCDLIASQNGNATFTSMSIAGNVVWCSGQEVKQYRMSPFGAVRIGSDPSTGLIYGSSDVSEAMQRIVQSASSGHLIESDLTSVYKRAIDAEKVLVQALKPATSAPFGTPPQAGNPYDPNRDPKLMGGSTGSTNLSHQLQAVARMIEANNNQGIRAKRQVFFVSLGAFDTHNSQLATHANNMGAVANAMAYFDATMIALGMQNQVTTFTASDFGRTLTQNGAGTDHGWGGHHFVMGGAVKGGDIYGNFPVFGSMNPTTGDFDDSPQLLNRGVLLPEVSVDQMGATLARWFGVPEGQLADVFPNLSNFGLRDLGFMKA